MTLSPNEETRLLAALESIADSLAEWCKLNQARFDKEYPVKPDVTDAVVTRIPTDEELRRKAQGASDEPIEDWLTLGPRERKFNESRKTSDQASSQSKK